jgi:hypothetical protein
MLWMRASASNLREDDMIAIPKLGGALVRHVGLAAAALLMSVGLQSRPADAVSLASPGAASLAQQFTDARTTEARFGGGGHGGGMHMGGGGMHFGGGGGGMHFGGGGFHAAPMFHGGGAVFHGGGMRYGGMHYGGIRYGYGGYGWRHFHHRHFFFGGFYPYYYGDYYPYYRRCRIIWTYFGPRRVCHRPWWYRPYWW